MIEQDTIKLLRECDAGIKMGIDSINEIFDRAESTGMKDILEASRHEHQKLKNEIEKELHRYKDEGKEPAFIARSMSFMKTEVKMGLDKCDATIADLMIDGCDMGVKSLSRYLNEYTAADERSKDVCKKLIALEEHLAKALRDYL